MCAALAEACMLFVSKFQSYLLCVICWPYSECVLMKPSAVAGRISTALFHALSKHQSHCIVLLGLSLYFCTTDGAPTLLLLLMMMM